MNENVREFPPPLDGDKVRSLETDALLRYLQSGSDGLSAGEAQARLAFYGSNSIQEKQKSAILKFLSY
ncbi:MAG: cation-transporting P-type ATPase, partial [Gammaproteobacteria bacterium]